MTKYTLLKIIGLIALATAIGAVAALLGFPLRLGEEPSDSVKLKTAPGGRSAASPTRARHAVQNWNTKADVRGAESFGIPGILPNLLQAELPITIHALASRAQQVEDEANRRLGQLTEKYRLTERQQDLIFPVLVYSSPAYHPELAAEGGGDGPKEPFSSDIRSIEERIYRFLTGEQRLKLQQHRAARDLWWSDSLARIDAGKQQH